MQPSVDMHNYGALHVQGDASVQQYEAVAALSKRVAELEAEVQHHKQHAGKPNKQTKSVHSLCSLVHFCLITPTQNPFRASPQRTGETKATNVRHSLEPLSLFAAAHQHHTQPS